MVTIVILSVFLCEWVHSRKQRHPPEARQHRFIHHGDEKGAAGVEEGRRDA